MKIIDNQDDPAAEKPKKDLKKKILKLRTQKASKRQIRSLILQNFQKKRCQTFASNRQINWAAILSLLSQQSFSCMICLDLLIHPTTLQCGHSFCLPCIQSQNKTESKYRCSLCRADDQRGFYQIDRMVAKVVDVIAQSKLQQVQKLQYHNRRALLQKKFKERMAQQNLKINHQIKIRVKNKWERARVLSLINKNNCLLYQVETILTEQLHLVKADSINIIFKESENKKDFSTNPFIEDYIPYPVNNRHEFDMIEDLLLEVNFYSPGINNAYESEEEVSYVQLQSEDIAQEVEVRQDNIVPDMHDMFRDIGA